MKEIPLSKQEKELDLRIQNEGWLDLSELTKEYAELSAIIHVDTRDFHVNFSFESQLEQKAKKFLKEISYNKKVDYLTFEQIIDRLKNWKEESGGEAKWRLINHKTYGWFKYVRIFRTESGYVWCSSLCGEYRFFTNNNLELNIELKDENRP
jgi:hypothetical protein